MLFYLRPMTAVANRYQTFRQSRFFCHCSRYFRKQLHRPHKSSRHRLSHSIWMQLAWGSWSHRLGCLWLKSDCRTCRSTRDSPCSLFEMIACTDQRFCPRSDCHTCHLCTWQTWFYLTYRVCVFGQAASTSIRTSFALLLNLYQPYVNTSGRPISVYQEALSEDFLQINRWLEVVFKELVNFSALFQFVLTRESCLVLKSQYDFDLLKNDAVVAIK